MRLNIRIKIDPNTGEPINQDEAIHDAMVEWISDALSELKDPNTGNLVSYSIISCGSDPIPQVQVSDSEFQAQADSLIQAKSKRESPFR